MNPAERQSGGAAADQFDSLKDELRAVFESHQSKPVEDLHRSDDRLDKPLRATPKDFQRPKPQWKPADEDEPVERDDLRSGFPSDLDQEASERQANHDRLVPIENEMKRRGSQGFG